MKRFISAAAIAVFAAGSLTVLAAPAQAAIGDGCRVTDFSPPAGSVTSYYKVAKITHGTQYTLPPHSSLTRTWSAENFTSITGTFNWESGGSIGLSGITKIIGSVQGHYGVKIAAEGVKTTTTTQSSSLTVNNTSSTNKTYVFFAGATRYYGQYRQQYCRPTSSGSAIGSVQWKYGNYSSWAVFGKGGVMCGASTTAALPKAAQAWGCG